MTIDDSEYLDPVTEQDQEIDARSPIVVDLRSGVETRPDGQRRYESDSDGLESERSDHFVQFYEADGSLLDAVEDFIGTALRAGDVGIVIATTGHREGLEERLLASGLDVAAARAANQFVSLDAFETMTKFMVDGAPDSELFKDVIGSIISKTARVESRVRIFGGMVALLVADGNHSAAIRLEELWNDLQTVYDFSLFCAYPMDQFGGESFADLFSHVNAAHTRVIPAESYTALPTREDRLRAIAVLQQKSLWLEAEILERKQAEERLRVALAAERVARQEAESALRLRDEFLSIAAHELKTPLTGLSGQAQLSLLHLKRTGQLDPTRVRQSLEVISAQADKLSRLLNQLLDVSRLESGKLTLERQPTDLAELVQQVVSDVRLFTDRHSINVTVPSSVRADVDPLRLEQVLVNLMNNAITYSPDDGSIDVVLTNPSSDVVDLSVRDRGVGIPPEMRDQIFERFYQADNGDSKRGLGLGLYISRQIVELHGGEIRVETLVDGGTRFIVRLPIGPDQAATTPASGSDS